MPANLVEQYRLLHAAAPGYGASSVKRAPYILPYIHTLSPQSVIDFGCGQSALADVIAAAGVPQVMRYDPAIASYATPPAGRFDLLLNIDVLEHVEERELDLLVAHMASLSDKALIIIDTRPAKTILPNGQNAHVTLRPAQWWQQRLLRFYARVERIKVRRRPASFRTFTPDLRERMTIAALTVAHRARDRWLKLKTS